MAAAGTPVVLERDARAAGETREAARAALIQAEREDASSGQVAKLERQLEQAEADPSQRWPEKIEGARQALRDADLQVRRLSAERLDELVETLEQDGEVAAKNLTRAAEAVVAAFHAREAVAYEIAETCTAAGARLRPGDVTRSKAEQLVAAASELLDGGGEQALRLRRDPTQPIHGKIAEAVPTG
jgi:hypothetical protein